FTAVSAPLADVVTKVVPRGEDAAPAIKNVRRSPDLPSTTPVDPVVDRVLVAAVTRSTAVGLEGRGPKSEVTVAPVVAVVDCPALPQDEKSGLQACMALDERPNLVAVEGRTPHTEAA